MIVGVILFFFHDHLFLMNNHGLPSIIASIPVRKLGSISCIIQSNFLKLFSLLALNCPIINTDPKNIDPLIELIDAQDKVCECDNAQVDYVGEQDVRKINARQN